jgi:hypothetical protein
MYCYITATREGRKELIWDGTDEQEARRVAKWIESHEDWDKIVAKAMGGVLIYRYTKPPPPPPA